GRQLAVPFGVSLIFWGFPIALIPAWPRVAVAFLLLAVVGAAHSVADVDVITLLQRVIPDDVLTRVLGIVWGLAMGAIAVGSVAATGVGRALAFTRGFLALGGD